MKNILYIADIFGPKFIKKRKPIKNLSFAGTTKVLSIASSLINYGIKINIYSMGSPAERSFTFKKSFSEKIDLGNKYIDIIYGFSFDFPLIREIFSSISMIIKIPKFINSNSIDTLIIYNLSTFNVLFSLIFKLFGLNIILQYEDSVTESRDKKNNIKKLLKFYEIIIFHIAKGVFGPTKKLTLKHRNSLVIPGIISEDILASNLKTKYSHKEKNESLKIIYAGGLDKSKGIDLFLKALDFIDYDIEMIICGTGPIEKQIQNLCKTNKHTIKFLGVVDRNELIKYLYWADIGINCHLDIHSGGSWPFKVIEYLATCGTVFSSRLNSMPEELDSKIYLYDGYDVSAIYNSFKSFIKKWPLIKTSSNQRRNWAIKNYSSKVIGEKLHNLIYF